MSTKKQWEPSDEDAAAIRAAHLRHAAKYTERAAELRQKAAQKLDDAVFQEQEDNFRRARIAHRSWHLKDSDRALLSPNLASRADYRLDSAMKLEERAAQLEREAAAYATHAERFRRGNPSSGGLSLYGLALGAALGAAILHFTMKPKQ
jgi:hypothetical protein